MHIYSTMEITKGECLTCIVNKLLQASNESLENILFELTSKEGQLYNYKIVENYDSDWHIKYKEMDI